jgi:hypothetical protein
MSQSETTFNEAKQIYLETYGDAITTGTYLKATVAVLSLIVLGLVILNLKTIQTFRNWRPLVIRVDDIGRAQALDYRSLEYHPGDAEAKYFLSEFCRLYYRRNRYTINDDFTKALYFLDGKLANDIIQRSKSEDTINKFLSDPGSAQVDVDVQKVTLQPMIKAPYQASVDFLPRRIRPGRSLRDQENPVHRHLPFHLQGPGSERADTDQPARADHHLLPARSSLHGRGAPVSPRMQLLITSALGSRGLGQRVKP